MMKKHMLFLFLIQISLLHAQNKIVIDSLTSRLSEHLSDTDRINTLNLLSWELKFNNPDTAIYVSKQALELSKRAHWQKGIAFSRHHLGSFYYLKSDFSSALNHLTSSLNTYQSMHDKDGIAKSLLNIGNIYISMGDYPKALKHYFTALKINKEINKTQNQVKCLGNIGNVYIYQEEYDKAMRIFKNALEINKRLGLKNGISTMLSNISAIYSYKKEPGKALEYQFKALKISEEYGNKSYMADNFSSIGTIYLEMGDYANAMNYLNKSLNINKSLGNDMYVSRDYINIGLIYMKREHFGKAENFFIKGLAIGKGIGSLQLQYTALTNLSDLYKHKGNYRKAYAYYMKKTAAKDSLYNKDRSKEIGRLEAQHEFDKKQAIAETEHKKELEKQKILATAEQKRQNMIIASVSGGLGIVLLFSIFLFNRIRVIRRQKQIIEKQKNEVLQQKELLEEKNKDITDSITYARRIQSAILPPEKLIKRYLPDSFILYKPKAIVAGDFYWMNPFDDRVLFAVADCTGHGVPGAMVSVVCHNALNRSVREYGLTKPGEILNQTREIIISEFEKSEEDVKDGMDIALCSLDTHTRVLQFAGAINPLWIIRKGAEEIEEIKGDKLLIGKYARLDDFTTHSIQLEKDDIIYLFSDGYTDQFGGPKGKKFKYKPFKKLLLQMRSKPMDEQRRLLDMAIESWKSWPDANNRLRKLEQVDDICIIGVKV